MLKELFEVLELLKESNNLRANGETLEFLSNALVLSVDEISRARSMGDLPKPNNTYPEVVFIGRSNVGKSSLGITFFFFCFLGNNIYMLYIVYFHFKN